MAIIIPVAFDFTCPQVYVGWKLGQRLQQEFDVEFDWLPYELWPEEIPWPLPRPEPPGKPVLPSRFDLQLLADDIERPRAADSRPKKLRVHLAMEGTAFVRDQYPSKLQEFVDVMMSAYWEDGKRIDDLGVILSVAGEMPGLRDALECRSYRDQVVRFDAAAYKSGVFHVPTFWIGEKRLAEPTYAQLKETVAAIAQPKNRPLYEEIDFPEARADRPYSYIDMVATIDGKIITGNRDEHVVDLGSAHDHAAMRSLEFHADAVLVGASTLRASKPSWSPRAKRRVVVSTKGEFDYSHRFFSEGAIVVTPDNADLKLPNHVEHLRMGGEVDLANLFKELKHRGVERLLVLGGSELNAQLLSLDLIDEIFLTVAPKIKLGKSSPTIAGGEPLDRVNVQNYEIVETHRIENEIFLRYRRKLG